MSNSDLQDEEKEVLLSIYEGDPAFNQLSAITYQYKFGEDGSPKSFLLELSWGENYPTEKPLVNMDTFYNKHIIQAVKSKITDHILKEADDWIGTPMTYTLFESVKENLTELLADQPDHQDQEEKCEEESEVNEIDDEEEISGKKAPKKDKLSKAQKRKQWDRVDSKGERPRGWDWVDVVKHLSQTGSKSIAQSSTA